MKGALSRKKSPGALDKVRANALANILAQVAEEDAQICRAMNLARRLRSVAEGEAMMEMPDELLKTNGWTREDLQVAIDAKNNSKFAPVYLKMAHERATVRWRDGQGEKAAPKAVAFIVPVPQQQMPPAKEVVIEVVEAAKK